MPRIRVMVAEDNLDTQQAVVRFLGGKPDIEVVAVAADGVEAINLARMTRPDVLVLDVVMPMLDGFEVIRLLREEGYTDMRIIVLSTLVRDALIRCAMDLGAYYYLAKPFDMELLYSYIVRKELFLDESISSRKPPMDEAKLLDMLLGETLGIALHTRGGRYLHAAVRIAAGLDRLSGRITKDVYPAVARLYDTNAISVERAIRSAIEQAWDNGDMKASELFNTAKRPSNGEVINVVCGMYNLRIHQNQGSGMIPIPSNHFQIIPVSQRGERRGGQ